MTVASGASARELASAPADVTRRARSNFSLSFAFLGPEQRAAMHAIYAYCRAVDDAVDDAPDAESGRVRLGFWREELAAAAAGDVARTRTETGRALAEVMPRFSIEERHLAAVADGCESDLRAEVRFDDLVSLEGYCAQVASAVGLACLPVFGVDEASCGLYADRLGKALQITNILRDLRTDAEIGRTYAPDDMLAAAGVERAWLRGDGPAAAYREGGPVHRLVEALARVAHERFDEAWRARPSSRDACARLVTAEIMAAVYYRLLELVEARAGRIDRPDRLRVSKPRKIWLALRTWRRGGRLSRSQ